MIDFAGEISTVTHLTLVTDIASPDVNIDPRSSLTPTVPERWLEAASTMLAGLAASLPKLTHLTVDGDIGKEALHAFGFSCPMLSSLTEACDSLASCRIPDLTTLLPHLTQHTVFMTTGGVRALVWRINGASHAVTYDLCGRELRVTAYDQVCVENQAVTLRNGTLDVRTTLTPGNEAAIAAQGGSLSLEGITICSNSRFPCSWQGVWAERGADVKMKSCRIVGARVGMYIPPLEEDDDDGQQEAQWDTPPPAPAVTKLTASFVTVSGGVALEAGSGKVEMMDCEYTKSSSSNVLVSEDGQLRAKRVKFSASARYGLEVKEGGKAQVNYCLFEDSGIAGCSVDGATSLLRMNQCLGDGGVYSNGAKLQVIPVLL